MISRDVILVETVKTHRVRLLAALLFGELEERRIPNDNLKRWLGGAVLAAVACAGCIGFALISTLLATVRRCAPRSTRGGRPPRTPGQARSGRPWPSGRRRARPSKVAGPTSGPG